MNWFHDADEFFAIISKYINVFGNIGDIILEPLGSRTWPITSRLWHCSKPYLLLEKSNPFVSMDVHLKLKLRMKVQLTTFSA